MKLKKKSYLFLSILALFGGMFLFFSHALNRAEIEEKTYRYLETLSGRVQGDIVFGSSRLKLLPTPHLEIKNVLFILPDKGSGAIKSLHIFPSIIPLFAGKMKISRLQVKEPDIQVVYSPEAFPGIPDSPVHWSELKQAMEQGLAFMRQTHPDLRVRISRGNIDIQSPDKSLLFLKDITTTLTIDAQVAGFTLACESSLWRNAHINFQMDALTGQSKGTVDFYGIAVKDAGQIPFRKVADQLSSLTGDVHLSFQTKTFFEISGSLTGTSIHLVMRPPQHDPLSFQCKSFDGSFIFDADQTLIRMDKMVMTEPEAVFSGAYIENKKLSEVTLEVKGWNVNAASARKASLALAGQFRTTRILFDYVREGQIPWVTFFAKAPSLKDFKKPGAISLDGTITRGKVFIPHGKLDLYDTSGQVRVADGYLIGKNLSARTGDTLGTRGEFSIPLHDRNSPFFLAIQVDADVSQLPPVLIRLIHNEKFIAEMDKVKNCKGRATGKLTLGGRRNAIRPLVEVNAFSISADYLQTPMAVSLTGKKLLYNNKRITIASADAQWGQSEFTNTSVVFDWQTPPVSLTWHFENATLITEPIYAWLKSIPRFATAFYPMDRITGTISLSKTQISGPMFSPLEWTLETSGKMKDLTLSDPFFSPEKAIVINGDLRAGSDGLLFSNTSVRATDTELTGSVQCTGPMKEFKACTLSIQGQIGSPMLPWFSRKLHLPFAFQKDIRANLSDMEIQWLPGMQSDFSGRVEFPDHFAVRLSGQKTREKLDIHTLTIKDHLSSATLGFTKAGGEFTGSFNGFLNGSSLDPVMVSDKIFSGIVSGDFSLGFDADDVMKAYFKGTAEAKDLVLQNQEVFPFAFDALNVTSDGQTHGLDARFVFKGTGPHSVTGNIYHRPEDIFFDLVLDSESIHVEQILSYLKKPRSEREQEEYPVLYTLPVKGDIQTTVREVRYHKYQWASVAADVRITPEAVRIHVLNGSLCGINTPGHLVIGANAVQLDVSPLARKQKLEKTLVCLGGKEGFIQGDFALNGEIFAGDKIHDLISSLQGDFNFSAVDGRIYKLNLLSKIFALLNITEIFRGNLPDLAQEGFAFARISADGTVTGQKIIITNGFIDGASMGMGFKGAIDTEKKELDLTLLVSPLKTVDFILQKTPIIKDLFKGAVVSIPLQVQGDMANPTVKTLSLASVDTGLIKLMKDTLKLPITLIQPLLAPDTREEPTHEPESPKN